MEWRPVEQRDRSEHGRTEHANLQEVFHGRSIANG
jgi:hypothetical protein